MGYPKDLDEYTDKELEDELARRAAQRSAGLCAYCGRPGSEPPCKFYEVHAQAIGKVVHTDKKPLWAVVDVDNFANENSAEYFVGDTARGVTETVAKAIAEGHNKNMSEHSPRFYRVVRLPYKLEPGFQP